MEPDKMVSLVFTDEMKFGIREVDEHHRRMVKIVNHLVQAVARDSLGEAEDRLLDELVQVATEAFRLEEEWMRRCGYRHAEVHAESHGYLLDELVQLRDGLFQGHEHLNRKAIAFLRLWLEGHLRQSDRELAEAVRGHLQAGGKPDSIVEFKRKK